MSPTAAQLRDFAVYARRPETWSIAAKRQLAVALHLFEHERELGLRAVSSFEERSGSHYAAYLHAGLAVENAAKACLVAKDPSIVTDQGSVDRTKFGAAGGHGLSELAERAIGCLPPHEAELLRKLQEYVVWAGKYTVPMSAQALYDEQRMNRLREAPLLEKQLIEGLVHRLLAAAK